jgi:hypothetical protein
VLKGVLVLAGPHPGFDTVQPLHDLVQPAGHILLGLLLHEVGGDRGRDHPEHGDAGDHQHDRDGAAGRRHREAVAAADRGDRGHRPPQRIR